MNPIHRRYIDACRAHDENPCDATLSDLNSAREAVLKEARREKPALAGYCKDCMYYKPSATAEDFGFCEMLAWNGPSELAGAVPNDPGDKTLFVCMPNFGCVQFEGK